MELKNYFAQDAEGNAQPYASCYLYSADTSNLINGLVDAANQPLTNPFVSDSYGLIQFKAPNGIYDLRVISGNRDYKIRVQAADVTELIDGIDEAVAAADTATTAAELSQSKADLAAIAAESATDARDAAEAYAIDVLTSVTEVDLDRIAAQQAAINSADAAETRVAILRGDLASTNGFHLIGAYDGSTVKDEFDNQPYPITRAGAVGDWDGTTGTNNKVFIKNAFDQFKTGNNRTLYVPAGRFHVDLLDSDLTDLGFGRDFAWLIATGNRGLMITGPGEIHVSCNGSTKRVLFAAFKNCDSCHVFKFNLTGDLVKDETVANSEIGVAMGFMFYNCTNSGIRDSYLRGLIVPAWYTGQPKSPATVLDKSRDCYLSNNTIENYEQCSTFGAGAMGLRVDGNFMINSYIAFKVSQMPMGSADVGKGGRIEFYGNNIYWTPDAKFSVLWTDPAYSVGAAGIMIECGNTDVNLHGNIISFADITPPPQPLKYNAAPVVIFKSGVDAVPATRITVGEGTYIAKVGYGTGFAVDSTADVNNLVLKDFTHVGSIRVQSGAVSADVFGDLVIKNLTGDGLPGQTLAVTVGAGSFRNIEIEGCTLNGTDGQLTDGNQSIFNLTGFVCTNLILKNNTLPVGAIGNFGATAVTCGTLISTGNTLRSIDLSTIGCGRVVLDNDCTTSGLASRLILDAATKAACRVSVSGSCGNISGNSTTALNLNGGLLRIDSSLMFANSASAFIFDPSVVIQGGAYYGSGAPTQSAFLGVVYNDLQTGANGSYIKMSSTGSTSWLKITAA